MLCSETDPTDRPPFPLIPLLSDPNPGPTHLLSSDTFIFLSGNTLFKTHLRGAWVAQSVERPTSAQVTISHSVGPSPAPGSVLTAQSLEPASDSVSPPLSAPPLLMLGLSRSQK